MQCTEYWELSLHTKVPNNYELTKLFIKYVFEKFWKRELDLEDYNVIISAFKHIGINTNSFKEWSINEGKKELEGIKEELEAIKARFNSIRNNFENLNEQFRADGIRAFKCIYRSKCHTWNAPPRTSNEPTTLQYHSAPWTRDP